MKLNLKARDWHNWMAVILLIPMLLVGLTAPFLAHKQALKLQDIDVSAAVSWLPGYGAAAMKAETMEVRAGLVTADGMFYIGSKNGLYRIAGGQAVAVDALAGKEVRALLETPAGLLAATKQGLWQENRNGWQKVHSGEAWQLARTPDGSLLAAFKKEGLMHSRDGGTRWEKHPAASSALAAVPMKARQEEITLGKLMLDLHTGKAFFGKEWEWIWIDLLGAVWVFLGFTGLWLWWRSQVKRRNAARGRLAAEVARG